MGLCFCSEVLRGRFNQSTMCFLRLSKVKLSLQKRVCRRLDAAAPEQNCPQVRVCIAASGGIEEPESPDAQRRGRLPSPLPNSGQGQPAMGVGSCSHQTSLYLFSESVNNCCPGSSAAVICWTGSSGWRKEPGPALPKVHRRRVCKCVPLLAVT